MFPNDVAADFSAWPPISQLGRRFSSLATDFPGLRLAPKSTSAYYFLLQRLFGDFQNCFEPTAYNNFRLN